MKNTIYRNIALILALITVVSVLVACKQTGGTDETKDSVRTDGTTGTTLITSSDVDPIPDDLKFTGRDFVIAAPVGSGPAFFWQETDSDIPIDSAIYKRNKMLEERFEITISAIELGDTGHHADALLPYIDAGDDVIDVCAIGYYQSGKPLIVYDLILPWNGVKYIDYSKPWWNSSLNDTLSILGQSYYLSGAINWTQMSVTMAVFFNKNVAGKFSSVVGDLYKSVNDGTWTQERMLEMIKAVSSDNGDGVRDENDTYGLCQNINTLESWVTGAGMQYAKVTDSGFELYFDSERLVDLIDKVGGVLTDKQYVWLEEGMNTGTNIFFEDRALFIQSDFTYCEAWRNQKSDFGILPIPKADEKQEKYLTYSDQWGLALAMPKTAKEPDRTGAILEMMAQMSYEMIRPAYYEKTLMGKYSRDDESEEMLNIIFDGITYEPGITFISNLAWLPFRDCVINNKNLASWYAGYRNQIEQNFTELFDSVKERTE